MKRILNLEAFDDPNWARSTSPTDVCECGDYRRQHDEGTGYCVFNTAPKDEARATNDLNHGFQNCLKFRWAL